LEIGVYLGSVFKNVDLEIKDGVDPAYDCNYKMTSDKFFEQLPEDKKYDLIFIDGMHEHKQVLRDISNSLNHLSLNGTIALHDCNPPTKWHQRDPSEFDGTGKFNGTVWKAFVEYRYNRKDLAMFVVDCDWGVGIIRTYGKNKFPNAVFNANDNITDYEWLSNNRKRALNLIETSEFNEWIVYGE
jgi:hypothetical protein